MATPANNTEDLYFEGGVPAEFPLALLEAVRAHDHPGELLEDEDVTVSLPRRLGLSGVVETQIMRYQSTQRAGRLVSLNEVFALVRLVLRRPDAELILHETGHRIAELRYRRMSQASARLYRILPRSVTLLGTFRRLRSTFRELQAGDSIAIQRLPLAVRVRGSNTARLDATGTACSLFTAVLERFICHATGRDWTVRHPQCEARGAPECEWRAEEVSLVGFTGEQSETASEARPSGEQGESVGEAGPTVEQGEAPGQAGLGEDAGEPSNEAGPTEEQGKPAS